jgi:flavin-dependent dehydrogenase/polyisoprenoid-binding protein YceI
VSIHFDTDVFVAGGGPAARRQGFRVVLADCAVPPIDKACGEGLMPDAQLALQKLGIGFDASEGFPFRGIRFLGGAVSVDASFPHGQGIGVRRTVLHNKMVRHAADSGVDLLWGTRVSGIYEDRLHVGKKIVRARWIVGADGGGSDVRHWSGLDGASLKDPRFGFRLHFPVVPWTDCMEIYWGDGCQIYVTPVGPADICVALISRDKHLRLERALNRFPELVEKLKRTPPVTTERGALSATRRLKRVCRGNVALAGDASGSVDAITGEGICLGLKQALALAEALVEGDLTKYQAEHNRILRRPTFMARTMLLMENRTALRRRALKALSSSPRIFRGMLAMHVGAASPMEFAVNGMELGWRMLAGYRTEGAPMLFPRTGSSVPAVVLLCCGVLTSHLLHGGETVVFDPARTAITFTLGDVLHTVHGTFKLKSGVVHFDPNTGKVSGSVVVDATSGESGSGARDRRMHKNVLQSDRYPEIVFTPDRLAGKMAMNGTAQIQMHGLFRIHGEDHEMTLDCQVGTEARQVTASTHFSVPYVQWGMKNPSTFILKVKETVDIDVHATGQLSDGPP